MREIRELTEDEAKDILTFVYPNDKYVWFREIRFEEIIDEKGYRRITFGGEPIIGILYSFGINSDGAVLPFTKPKVIEWLIAHDFNTTNLP